MKCRLCTGELFSQPVLQLKGMPKAAQYYPEADEFVEDKGLMLNIYQCSCCGLVQLAQKPVDYFKEVITAATLSGKSRLARLNQMKEFTSTFSLAGKKVLDIGCGKGEMLDVLAEAGLVPTGIEAAEKSVAIGKEAGRSMIHGYIGDEGIIAGAPYDGFICLNYLEHLPAPAGVIKNIYRNTVAGTVGYVTVPNLDYLLKTRSHYEFVADHLSYFTRKTLGFAFEANGFEVLDCKLINDENDIALSVKKRMQLDLSAHYSEVEELIRDLQRIIAEYKLQGKKVAVWGAGHRTLALLALAHLHELEYIVDSAPFKHGKFTPVLHHQIVAPDHLMKQPVDLLIVMVPGIYPDEVIKTAKKMNTGAVLAKLVDNRIEFII